MEHPYLYDLNRTGDFQCSTIIIQKDKDQRIKILAVSHLAVCPHFQVICQDARFKPGNETGKQGKVLIS